MIVECINDKCVERWIKKGKKYKVLDNNEDYYVLDLGEESSVFIKSRFKEVE
ncbi:TPA: hypothetical protein ACH354_002215 [Clostridium perfringens]